MSERPAVKDEIAGATRPKSATIEEAFRYRGDVTIECHDGARIVGYLYHRDVDGPEPVVGLFVRGRDEPVTAPISRIRQIWLTGADPAAGRSWQAWLESVAQAEADGRIAQLYPESLDD